MTPRDRVEERQLVEIAALSCGLASRDITGVMLMPATEQLERFADRRAGDRPIRDRAPDDWSREVAEELADARNYCVWWAQRVQPGFLAGDPEAAADYSRAIRALVGVMQAWAALCGP